MVISFASILILLRPFVLVSRTRLTKLTSRRRRRVCLLVEEFLLRGYDIRQPGDNDH